MVAEESESVEERAGRRPRTGVVEPLSVGVYKRRKQTKPAKCCAQRIALALSAPSFKSANPFLVPSRHSPAMGLSVSRLLSGLFGKKEMRA